MEKHEGKSRGPAAYKNTALRMAWRVFGIGIAALLAGCSAASGNASDTFVLGVEVTGSAGAGIDITITDESGPTLLINDTGITALPVTREAAGNVDFSTAGVFTVAVSGTNIPAGESFSVTVTYTENSYLAPFTQTLDETTVPNSTAGAANLEYLFPLVAPYQ